MIETDEHVSAFVEDVAYLPMAGEPPQLKVTITSGRTARQLNSYVRKLYAVLPGTRAVARGWDTHDDIGPNDVVLANTGYKGVWGELDAAKINMYLGALVDQPVLSVDLGSDPYVVMVALAYAPAKGELLCLLERIEGLVRVVRAKPAYIYGGMVLALVVPEIRIPEQLPHLRDQIIDVLRFA